MKIVKPLKHRGAKSAIINSHLCAAVAVGVIIYLLTLYGCSTPLSVQGMDQCKVLAAKRVAKYKPFRQPKLTTANRSRTKSTQRDNAAKYTYTSATWSPSLTIADTIPGKELQPAITLLQKNPSLLLFDSPAIAGNTRPLSQKKSKPASEEPSLPITDVNPTRAIGPFIRAGLWTGISAFASIFLLATFRYSFMKISAWAAHHPVTSKAALITIHTASSLGALIAGHYFARLYGPTPDVMTVSAAGGFIVAAALYPTTRKRLDHFSNMYLRQKVHDVSLFATGVMLSLCVGSHLEKTTAPTPQDPNVLYSATSSSLTSHHPTLRENFLQDPPEKKEGKVAMIIISSILFTVGLLVVAAISCSLFCSGANAAAVLLLAFGGGALIAGYVAVLRSIERNRKIRRRKS